MVFQAEHIAHIQELLRLLWSCYLGVLLLHFDNRLHVPLLDDWIGEHVSAS